MCFTLLQIFSIDETYKVELEFTNSVEEVENTLKEIVRFVSLNL